jgi:hypothetical protein
VERGPMALFGAIVAVGLGPAMWLGAQFGQVTLSPERPPAVVQQNGIQTPRGGSGAGDAPVDQTEAIRTEPKANTEPLKVNKRARPVVTVPARPSSPSDDPSPEPTTTTPTTPTSPPPPDPGDEPTDPPTESTDEPTDSPTEGDPGLPPEPPTTEVDTNPVTDSGFTAA